jgi:ATP-dependent helicase/nuclease subunit B
MLNGETLASGHFQRSAVTVCGLMEARGTTHDVVFVPQMVEKNFPRHIPSDPILADRDREALTDLSGELGCGELPAAGRRPQEEVYLFQVALASAREALVLTYPRLDESDGRARVFSRFVQEVCETLCGRPVRLEEIDTAQLGGLVKRVRLGLGEASEFAVDEGEYDLAAHAAARRRGAALAYTGSLCDGFARAVEMERLRWRSQEFGPCDGRIAAAGLSALLKAGHASFSEPISPSRLETYAGCPFHYFLKYVLEVEEVEKPAEEFEESPAERGRLIHAVLRDLYRSRLCGTRLGELDDERIRAAQAEALRLADRAGRVQAGARPAVWQARREIIQEQAALLLALERAQNGDATPAEFELTFGLPGPAGCFELEVPGGPTLRIHGRVDRVDRLADGGVQIIDYKSGKVGKRKVDSLAGGCQLQLPLYLLAVSDLKAAGSGRARYVFLGDMKFQSQYTLKALRGKLDELRHVLRLIVEGIVAGDFFPLPAESAKDQCSDYCPFRSACGEARSALAEAKAQSAGAERLRELRAISG